MQKGDRRHYYVVDFFPLFFFFPAEKLHFMVVTSTSPVFFLVHEGGKKDFAIKAK